MEPKNLIGRTFGRLTVISRSGKDKRGKSKWLCRCICGKEKAILADSLISGKTKSCGCLRAEISPKNVKVKHGMSGSRLWVIWCGMKSRCYNPKSVAFSDYGGRGIRVCDSWKSNFLEFYHWATENGYSELLTIDRINSDGNYEPENCRWATYEEQENNRRNTVFFTISGIKLSVSEWARITGIPAATLRWRIENGWDEEHLLISPNLNNRNIRRAM